MQKVKNLNWKINLEKFSEFDFIKDEVDLLIINNVIDKTYVNINDLFEYVNDNSKTKVNLRKVQNRFEKLVTYLKQTNIWRGLNYPDETNVKDLYLIRQNSDSFKKEYLNKNIFNYHLVYENEEVSEIINSIIELEEGSRFKYNGLDFEVTSKLLNDILAENI